MTCLRCRRLIIEDQFLDLESPYGQMWTTSLRCANCGHIHGSVIEQPHLAQQEKVVHPLVVSQTIRMTKSILEPSPSSDEWLDIP